MKIVAALMLKAPRPGMVKTRLAKSVGPQEASAIYRELVERQLLEIPADWSIAIHYAPADGLAEMENWLAKATARELSFHAQPEGDLGARMHAAVDEHLRAGVEAVVLIGGDCPGLNGAVLKQVQVGLNATDVAIVPARDGGYVCLATKVPAVALFTGIDWSTERVLAQTLSAADSAGLLIAGMDPLEDVDDLESLKRCGLRPDLWS